MVDVAGDDQYSYSDNGEVIAYFFHFKCLSKFLCKNKEIYIKVYPKQNHEYSDHYLKVGTVTCHAVSFNTKTSGTGSTECSTESVKQRHFSNQQKYDLDQCYCNVDGIQDFGSRLYFWSKFTYRWSRAFCFHQVHVVTACKRQQRKDEDQNSHTSDPVCETSPDQYTVRQCFYIC